MKRPGLPLLLALGGGVAFALTSPPTDLYPAVVVGLGLLAASLGAGTGRDGGSAGPWPSPPGFWRAFGRGAAWGTAAGVVGLRFVPVVVQRFTDLGTPASLLALVLLAAAQSLIWAIGAGVTVVLHRRARLPFELAFGAGVLVALSLPTIFAWSPAGLVSPWPAFVQLADVIGERGVSVLFAIGAASLARAAAALAAGSKADAVRPAIAGVAVFVLLPIYGALRIASITRDAQSLPVLRVGLVDQAVSPNERWTPANAPSILHTLRRLTTRVEHEGAQLTVWPEGAYPYVLDHELRAAPPGRHALLGEGVRGPLLVGLLTHAKPVRLASGEVERNSYNSATLVLPDGSLQAPYDKLQLLWFGEMVPGGAQIPWLRHVFQRGGGLIPGDGPRALDLPASSPTASPAAHLAVLNCYEDTLPDLGRRLARALEPGLLVNITNDSWFHDTGEPELHARLGAMRAVELRRDLVRAVNLGVASWVDAAGVVRAREGERARRGRGEGPRPEPGTMLVTPTLRPPALTFYARWGDAPVFALYAFATVISAGRRRRAPSPPRDHDAHT